MCCFRIPVGLFDEAVEGGTAEDVGTIHCEKCSQEKNNMTVHNDPC